jgi:DNA invertase Pin-like site-specific DNA recombinase
LTSTKPGLEVRSTALPEALERVEAGEADGIIVAALDRFARSVPDAAVALRRLEDAGAGPDLCP